MSKRRDKPYHSGWSPDWIKVENPGCAGRQHAFRGKSAMAPQPTETNEPDHSSLSAINGSSITSSARTTIDCEMGGRASWRRRD